MLLLKIIAMEYRASIEHLYWPFPKQYEKPIVPFLPIMDN
jgi:hypothetical protein